MTQTTQDPTPHTQHTTQPTTQPTPTPPTTPLEQWNTIPSEHDVYNEYIQTTGKQSYMQNDLFIATMTKSDIAKITTQLIRKQCTCISISEGDSYRRVLDYIKERRAWGNIAHLIICN